MNSTFSQQIEAIQVAMRGASLLVNDLGVKHFKEHLNDAASSIAYLNFTKDKGVDLLERVKELEQGLVDAKNTIITISLVDRTNTSDKAVKRIEQLLNSK